MKKIILSAALVASPAFADEPSFLEQLANSCEFKAAIAAYGPRTQGTDSGTRMLDAQRMTLECEERALKLAEIRAAQGSFLVEKEHLRNGIYRCRYRDGSTFQIDGGCPERK